MSTLQQEKPKTAPVLSDADIRNANTLIESIGVYLPPKRVSSQDILRACHHHILYPLERLTGIQFRRMAGEKEFAIDLAANAMAECFKKSRYTPADVDLLVCCNISRYDGPNFHFSFEPSTSMRLLSRFGMSRAKVFDISNACAGMFTGTYIANLFLKAGMADRVMVVSGEYITHLTETAQREICEAQDSRLACLTLGDSGAAMILERAPDNRVGFHRIDMLTLGRYSDLCIARPTREKHGGAIMFTESVKIHAVAIKSSVQHLARVLKQVKWPHRAMDYVIMHQTARTAISQTAQLINKFLRQDILNRDNMINNLAERGNTSTTSHFVAVWDNILNQKLKQDDNVVFAIQASGVTIGTAPYTFDDLPERLRQSQESNAPVPKTNVVHRAKSAAPIQRIRIESVGIVPQITERDAIKLAVTAGQDCLTRSRYNRQEIELLIHSGVHRNEFISEPALAALIAGGLQLNDDMDSLEKSTTFAYDIINGAIGTLNACYNAAAAIRSGTLKIAMVVASEIENNAEVSPDHLMGLRETGSAMILDQAPEGSNEGFGQFVFRYFPEYLEAFTSYIGQDRGKSYLSFVRDPQLERWYAESIPKTVRALLNKEGLELDDIDMVFPPQISSTFIDRVSRHLGVTRSRFVDISQQGQDYYTSSLPCAFHAARADGRAKPGKIGLVIAVGSGVQVGCAIYYF